MKCATKQRKVQRLNRERDCSSDKEDDDTYCLVCLDPFSNSKSREQWVQCFQCKKWSHEKCVEAGTTYICHDCYSDDPKIFSIRSGNVCTFVFINSSYHGFEFLARLNNKK